MQQYGSTAQIDVTQALQPLANAPPVAQSSCAQVTVPWQVPSAEQVWPDGQEPHDPPQPSEPHCLPVHCGTQPCWHWPSAEQVWPDGQVPHEPEQPSGPHCLPVHCGVQVVPPVTMQAPFLFDHCFCTM